VPYKYMRSILNIFVDSPLNELGEHAEKVIESTDRLSEMLDAYLEGDDEKVESLCQEIDELEHEADKMKQHLRIILPNSVVTKLDKTLLIAFLKLQDGIANLAQDSAHWMTLKSGADLPEEIKENLRELMKMSMKCIREYEEIIKGLEKIEGTSYSNVEIHRHVDKIPNLEKMEYEVDVFEIKVLKTIFKHENDISGAGIYHLVRLVDNIGDVADKTANAADIMRRTLLKET
jgi:TIGR00153 family protein